MIKHLGETRRRDGIAVIDDNMVEEEYKRSNGRLVEFAKLVPNLVEFVPLHNSCFLFEKQ